MTEYGIQLYSVRDIAEKSLKDALKETAGMGYRYIEFAGFFENSAEDVRLWLDKYGLKVSGTHTMLDKLTPDMIDETIAFHKAIGCDNIIVPCANWETREKEEETIAALNFAQKKLAENGIRLGYHNHSQEYFPTPDGTVFADSIIEKTDAELEIDTFWLFNAGIDVVDYLERYKDRIRVIHLKDGVPTPPENRNYENVHNDVCGFSVGGGKVPVKEIRKWAMENDVLMVVESEDLNPTGPEEAERCIKYLRTLD